MASAILVEPPQGRKPSLVPQGFSARGVVGDSGQFEMSTAKGLGAAALVGGAGVAAALGAAEKEPNRVLPVGEPFVTGPGIEFVSSQPPPGGTISSSGGFLALELRIFSPDEVPNALVTATLFTSVGLAPCLLFSSRHDLPARQAVAVTVNGPVRRESWGVRQRGPRWSVAAHRDEDHGRRLRRVPNALRNRTAWASAYPSHLRAHPVRISRAAASRRAVAQDPSPTTSTGCAPRCAARRRSARCR